MQKIKCEEVVAAAKGILAAGEANSVFSGISTDSRKISEGNLFIPIVGQNFDGHEFIAAAFQGGAAGCLSQKEIDPPQGKVVIRVENTVKALGDIAAYYRSKFNIPFIAVTGSVGKTSTKDMIAAVLGKKFNVLKTEGNFNNEIGLPATLLNLNSFHQACVVEMGMRGFGEISALASIARPDIAVITNIGMSHIERLGSRQNILKAKMEILEGLNPGGLVVLNGDDRLLYGLKGLLPFRTVFYGQEEGMDYRAVNVTVLGERGIDFDLSIASDTYSVHIPVPGIHNVYNALAAVGVGIEAGMPVNEIIEGIAQYSPGKMRLNIIAGRGIKIIDDVYNASPQSMEAALGVLDDISGNGRTIAVLGDMLELGSWSAGAHYDVGKFAASRGIDFIATVGAMAAEIGRGAAEAGMRHGNIKAFASNSEAVEFLKGFVKKGDFILVKGSRGMKMEQIVEGLLEVDRI